MPQNDQLQSDDLGVAEVLTLVGGPITYRTPATCDYHQPDDEGYPTPGTRCGKPAHWVILWDDWQYSLGCDSHIVYDTFEPDGWDRILEITTL